MLLAKAAQKKKSPKVCPTKKHAGSPREKSRASWNPHLEKTLVELLHEHNNPGYRGENGWSSDAWNKMVKEFHERDKYVTFTKAQIQEKEKELKRDYKMLKEARKQSGVHWNEQRCMIEAESAIWDNIITSFAKAKKFRNKSFPLFESLGELYDGHVAEGTYNFISTQPPNYPLLRQIDNRDEHDEGAQEVMIPDFEDTFAHHGQDEIEDASERSEEIPQKKFGTVSKNIEEKGSKRPKKSASIEGLMQKYLDMRTKQAQDEATQLTREKEIAQGL